MKTLAFFNNKGGVGKTTLVYHVSWMMSLLGVRTLVADLDPQVDLTSILLPEDETEQLWQENKKTISVILRSAIEQKGDISFDPVEINETLRLIPGDLSLSAVEDQLADAWSRCLLGDERAFNVTTGFSRVVHAAGKAVAADLAIIDVGPNLGAINRAALIGVDSLVIPLAADLSSLLGLEVVGRTLIAWRSGWHERTQHAPQDLWFVLPGGEMRPLGYVISRYHTAYGMPPVAVRKWLERVPATYRSCVMGSELGPSETIEDDPYKLAALKDYRSLVPMAQEARKPMFLLKPADGAIGGHQRAVGECWADFEALARRLLEKMQIEIS